MSCLINENNTFDSQQQKSFPSVKCQFEEKIIFFQNWRLCHLLVICDFPFITGTFLHHQLFSYRHCCLTGAHATHSPAALLPPDGVFRFQQANPTLFTSLPDCFAEFRVFYCLKIFPKDRGYCYCNALICFVSQTCHSSSLHIRVNTEELPRDRSLVSVKSVNGYSSQEGDHSSFIC